MSKFCLLRTKRKANDQKMIIKFMIKEEQIKLLETQKKSTSNL